MDDVRRPGAQPCVAKPLTKRSGAIVWLSMQPRTVDQLGLSPFLAQRQMSRQHAWTDGVRGPC